MLGLQMKCTQAHCCIKVSDSDWDREVSIFLLFKGRTIQIVRCPHIGGCTTHVLVMHGLKIYPGVQQLIHGSDLTFLLTAGEKKI